MGETVIGRAIESAEEGELLEVELGVGVGGEAAFRRLRPADKTADFWVRVTGKDPLLVRDVARIVHEERGVFFLRTADRGSEVDPIEVDSAGFVPWDGLIGYARATPLVDEDEEAAEDRAGPREVEPWDGDVLNKFGVGSSGGRVTLAIPPPPRSTLNGLEAMVLGAWLGVIGETVALFKQGTTASFDSVVAAVRRS